LVELGPELTVEIYLFNCKVWLKYSSLNLSAARLRKTYPPPARSRGAGLLARRTLGSSESGSSSVGGLSRLRLPVRIWMRIAVLLLCLAFGGQSSAPGNGSSPGTGTYDAGVPRPASPCGVRHARANSTVPYLGTADTASLRTTVVSFPGIVRGLACLAACGKIATAHGRTLKVVGKVTAELGDFLRQIEAGLSRPADVGGGQSIRISRICGHKTPWQQWCCEGCGHEFEFEDNEAAFWIARQECRGSQRWKRDLKRVQGIASKER